MSPEPERYREGQRVRIRSGTYEGKYGDVVLDRGAIVTVSIAGLGTVDLLREHVVAAVPISAAPREGDLVRRLTQLEHRLLTAKAELPAMIRELGEIRRLLGG